MPNKVILKDKDDVFELSINDANIVICDYKILKTDYKTPTKLNMTIYIDPKTSKIEIV